MSAIIELRDTEEKTWKKVKKVLDDRGFIMTGDSAYYVAVKYDPNEDKNKNKLNFPNFDVEKEIIGALTDKKYEGVLISPTMSLSKNEKASGRIAMAFYTYDSAEKGLASMYRALGFNPTLLDSRTV